jgi:hypothetical protein
MVGQHAGTVFYRLNINGKHYYFISEIVATGRSNVYNSSEDYILPPVFLFCKIELLSIKPVTFFAFKFYDQVSLRNEPYCLSSLLAKLLT